MFKPKDCQQPKPKPILETFLPHPSLTQAYMAQNLNP